MEVGNLKFAWKIKNFSKIQDEIIYSDVFPLGPYKWKICAYPKGEKEDGHLSIFLEVADSETLPSGWSLMTKFLFTLVDQIDSKSSIIDSDDGKYEFKAEARTRGLSSFISHESLRDLNKGYLVEDTCIINVDVTIYGDNYLESPVARKETNKENDLAKNATEEDIDAFFGDLNSVIFPKKVVSLKEEAKEALTMIEEALNMAPAEINNPSRMSRLKVAFDVLSSLDDCSILTPEQKEELVSMKDDFINFSDRAAQAVRDKNLFIEKDLDKKTLDLKLGKCLIRFEKAKAEIMQNEQDIAVLQQQICEKTRKRVDMTSKQKEMFKESKELKAELDVLVKHWPVYEARMNAAEEEEKVVGTKWSKMKQQFSSLKKPFFQF